MRIAVAVIAVLVVGCGDNVKLQSDAGVDGPATACGNGVVETNEDCDDGDGNGGDGARCDVMCHWVCLDANYCTDNEPCNGEEACVDHRCVAGTELVDGVSCGTGKICRNAACTDAQCGDSFITSPEECDDADSDPDNGCDNNCQFSCLSSDSARNCTPADPCEGQGTCNDNTHVCTPGTPLNNNDPCGVGGYCKNSVCTQPVCGNGMIEPGEVCDNGAANATVGDGCTTGCVYECVTAATDCPAAPFCQMPSCNGSHACANVADPAKQGMTCGTGLVCNNGACTTPAAVCGNGVTETGEQCDFGSGMNTAGSGCEPNCQFSCTISPNSCTNSDPCDGVETCGAVTVNSRPGQKCSQTAGPLGDGTMCGTNQICLSQDCVLSVCNDGFVDPMRGETCEPPNTATCDSLCHAIACGDSVRNGTEQCDDGNTTNLDGCDSTCKFEQCHRVNQLSLAMPPPATGGLTDTYCTANRLGSAIVGGTAQNQIAGALTAGVADGSITVMFQSLGLDDLRGVSDPALSLGALIGGPVAGTGYDGDDEAIDRDWWYTVDPSVVNASRIPTTTVPAMIAASTLDAGPADIVLTVNLGGSAAALDMRGAKITGNIGAATTPRSSTGSTPGHLASEHLDPALQSYGSMTAGKLCGNVTAQSLDNVPIPSALVGCGFLNCSRCYTAANSLLDVIVGGCFVVISNQIASTQPDGSLNANSYTFTPATTVTSCTKNGNQSATMQECLTNATYSAFLRFRTGRVIGK